MTRTIQTDADFEAIVDAVESRDFFRADALVAAIAARTGLSTSTVFNAALVEIDTARAA